MSRSCRKRWSWARLRLAGVAVPLLAAGALAAGCSNTPLQALPDAPAGRGYRVGLQLELRADRLLERPQGTLNPAPPILVRAVVRATPGMPARIADYRRDPGAYPSIIGLLPAGTRLEVTGIERRTYPGLESWYEVRARVVTGSDAGKLVSLDWPSAHGPDRTPLVDPAEFVLLP